MDDSFDELLANVPEPQNKIEDPPASTSKEEPKSVANNSKSLHTVLVNPKQKGNPLLKHITKVPWEFSEIVPDYQIGTTICALFLSLRYYNLNPDYIHDRLKSLKNMYELRVLLVQVDLKDPHQQLKYLTRMCILADLTLMLAFSPEEAGKIIENYKIYQDKPADKIMEKAMTHPHERLVQALTSIRPVNKTDAVTLLATFSTLEGVIKASEYQLSQCPGLGPRKAKKLYEALHKDFCKD